MNYTHKIFNLEDLMQEGQLVIPHFQRGIVWSKNHRKEFIETVKTGDPFGVILVSQKQNTDPYVLIDGLQRLSTLKAYINNPLEFIDENDAFIDRNLLNEVFVEAYRVKSTNLPKPDKLEREKKRFLKFFLKSIKSEHLMPKGQQLYKSVESFFELSENQPNSTDLMIKFMDFYDSFTDSLKLPGVQIYAIVYTGPIDRLATVFENLNTTSVTLTKYEIFSSQWPYAHIKINSDDIIENVWNKYKKLKESSKFEVEVTENDIRTDGITLFEYCFALSEILNDKTKPYGFLFDKDKKSTDPTGFELLALACGLKVNKADELYKKEYLGNADGDFLVSLKNALVESVNFIANCLKKWVFDIKDSLIKIEGTYQIYHLIIDAFNHMYDFNPEQKILNKKSQDIINKYQDKMKKYCYKWYLYHKLTSYWNINRQVNDLDTLIKSYKENDLYLTNVTREMWSTALAKYFDDSKSKAVSRSIDSVYQLILNYIYRLLLDEDLNRKKYFIKTTEAGIEINFDIEHIVPFGKFDRISTEVSKSSIGNLCYLPVKDNRSKRDKTIYEYAGDRPSLIYNEEFLNMILYPTKQELEFIDYPEETFVEQYNDFINTREQKLINQFVDLLMLF